MQRARTLVGRLLMTALALTVLAGCGESNGPSVQTGTHYATARGGDLRLSDGWVAAANQSASSGSMPGMDMGGTIAAYATITNDGSSRDALVAVTTPAADRADLHATRSAGAGTAGTMVPVAMIPVAAGRSVTLAPGGYHVMLSGLRGAFKAGSAITMTWRFRSGRTLTTRFPVIDVTDRPGSD